MSRRRVFQALGAAVVALCLLVFAGLSSAQGPNERPFERVKEVQESHTISLMARPGVVGTAIGLDDAGGLVIVVMLERPDVEGIPEQLNGIPVRSTVTGTFYALQPPAGKGPPDKGGDDPGDETPELPEGASTADWPWPIGVSTGHPDITAGTIGCRVIDGEGTLYALSNNHVYARENNASKGDYVIAPGSYDGGVVPDNVIGYLADFVRIVFGGRGRNKVDAAIAAIYDKGDTPAVRNTTPEDGYGTPNSETTGTLTDSDLGMLVQKYGRTTGLTVGTVSHVNASVRVLYSSGTAIFVEQIMIEDGTFSAGGDSGSLVVTADDACNPVGLLFAGSSSHTIANPIDAVLNAFNVDVDGKTSADE
jgi:hypothetical protein